MVRITIDSKPYEAEEDSTVLEVARRNGIAIPTLCYHPALKPAASCRLCVVEVPGRSGRTGTMLACVLKVRDGLMVRTDTDRVRQARAAAFDKLLQMAPQSVHLRELARHHGLDPGPAPDGCVRCRLCIRVCAEVVGAGALKMGKRDGRNLVVPRAGQCIGCGTCVNICPTSVIELRDEGNVRTISIRDEVIGRHPLTRCEGCGKYYATDRFVHLLEERTAPHPQTKTHHNYCANCAKLFSDRLTTVRDHSLKQRMPGHF
jgi:predicted molibdopterin-dependent oxidoreductase YjgC